MNFFNKAKKPVLHPFFFTSHSQLRVSSKTPPFPQFHGSSLTPTPKGINFLEPSSISSPKEANFHGFSSKGVNFHKFSSISPLKGGNFHGFSAKGVNFHGFSSILTHKGINFHVFSSNFHYNLRHYHVDDSKVENFTQKLQNLYQDPIPICLTQLIISSSGLFMSFFVEKNVKVWIFFMVASGIHWFTFCLFNLERVIVPYTKRSRFLLLSIPLERKFIPLSRLVIKEVFMGNELNLFGVKIGFGGKLSQHPSSARVRTIAQDIINALQIGIRSKEVWSDRENEAYSHDQGAKGICYVDGINWAVVVLDGYKPFSGVLPVGIIVYPSWMLDAFSSDSETAFLVAHEMAHAIARHSTERITRNLCVLPLQLLTFGFFWKKISALLRHPSNRKQELEADYIAVLLMAHAGYDPRGALQFFQKIAQVKELKRIEDKDSPTHPSLRKRVESLIQTKVLEEALIIYKENKSKCA